MTTSNDNERFTGHGAEWRDSDLSATDARAATAWVEQRIDKRSMETNKDRVEDVRDIMWQLEKDGEILVHRINDEHEAVGVKTLYGWDKRIPTQQLWHHKSCGQCGNIPGYPASLLWLMNQLEIRYLDETDQTSCTAWNYHGSGIGNLESLAAVFLRNFHEAYVADGRPKYLCELRDQRFRFYADVRRCFTTTPPRLEARPRSPRPSPRPSRRRGRLSSIRAVNRSTSRMPSPLARHRTWRSRARCRPCSPRPSTPRASYLTPTPP